jgi:hypothetical protein
VILAAAAGYLWLHEVADWTFPIPWPDEASFLWPAIAVERTNSLFAPQLNPDRDVLWMPPGYMVVSGLLFKIGGFSLSFARILSCAYLLLSFFLLLRLTGGLRLGPLWSLLCAAFLLSRQWIFAGNVARMEALVVLLTLSGFRLLAQRRFAFGTLLVGLTPLVHPNGFFFAAGATGLVVVERLRHRLQDRLHAGLLVGAAVFAGCWLAYLLYLAGHWADFRHDMQFQAGFKYAEGLLTLISHRMSRPAYIVALALSLAGLASAYRRDERLLPLAWLGIAGALLTLVAQGFNYTLYDSLFFLGAAVLGGEVFYSFVERRPAAVLALVLALLGSYLAGYVESPVGYPHRMRLHDLEIAPQVPYITDEEQGRVRGLLETLAAGPSSTTVRFYPSGDELLFADLDGEKLRMITPVFHSGEADVHILHRSRHIPVILDYFTNVQLREQGFTDADISGFHLLSERDGTEQWLWFRFTASSR